TPSRSGIPQADRVLRSQGPPRAQAGRSRRAVVRRLDYLSVAASAVCVAAVAEAILLSWRRAGSPAAPALPRSLCLLQPRARLQLAGHISWALPDPDGIERSPKARSDRVAGE